MAPAQGATPAAKPSYSSKRAELTDEDIAEAKARVAQRRREYEEAARVREEEQQVEQALKATARHIEKASRYRRREEAQLARSVAYKAAKEEANVAAMKAKGATVALKEDKFAAARSQRLRSTPSKPAWKPPGLNLLRQEQSEEEVPPPDEVRWRERRPVSRLGDRKREEDRYRAMTWAMPPPGPAPLEWRMGDASREQRVYDDRALDQLVKTGCLPDRIHHDGTMFSKDDHRLKKLLDATLRDEVSSNLSRDDCFFQQLLEVASDLSGDDRCLRQLIEARERTKAASDLSGDDCCLRQLIEARESTKVRSFAGDTEAVLDDEALGLLTRWRSALEVVERSRSFDSGAFDDRVLCDLVESGLCSMQQDVQLETDIHVLQHLLQGSATHEEAVVHADSQTLQRLLMGF